MGAGLVFGFVQGFVLGFMCRIHAQGSDLGWASFAVVRCWVSLQDFTVQNQV